MINITNLYKHYQDTSISIKTNVLIDINLQIKQGTMCALKGPSGSGKSTLLNLIAGLDRPSSGSITINDINLMKQDRSFLSNFRNQNIGIVFQFFNLINDLSVIENVALPMLISNAKKSLAYKKAMELIYELGLESRTNHNIKLLSGGEAQRVAIARSLINHPKIILADEPTGNLDLENTNNIVKLLIDSCKHHGATLLMVTHDEHLIKEFDQIYHLESGLVQKD